MNKKRIGIINLICAFLSIAAFFLFLFGEVKTVEAYRDSLGNLTSEQSSKFAGLALGAVVWAIIMAIPLGVAAVLGFTAAAGLTGKPKKKKDVTFGIFGIASKAITAAATLLWAIIFFAENPAGLVLRIIDFAMIAALIVLIILDIKELKKAE